MSGTRIRAAIIWSGKLFLLERYSELSNLAALADICGCLAGPPGDMAIVHKTTLFRVDLCLNPINRPPDGMEIVHKSMLFRVKLCLNSINRTPGEMIFVHKWPAGSCILCTNRGRKSMSCTQTSQITYGFVYNEKIVRRSAGNEIDFDQGYDSGGEDSDRSPGFVGRLRNRMRVLLRL